MSKPFSYHDENFTVIDNILFVHFVDSKERESFEPVIQVPDEIYKRMVSYGNMAVTSNNSFSYGGSYVGICIVYKNKIPYIAFSSYRKPASNTNYYYYSFYLLKDI